MRTFVAYTLFAACTAAQPSCRTTDIAAHALLLHEVKAHDASYKGRNAVRLDDDAPASAGDAGRFAVVNGTRLQDGSIDLDVAGDTAPDADPAFRGFVGLAFRVTNTNDPHFECFYLRPKNGRSADPVQRSHSTQYISIPGYPWQKLRTETPGKYESYVDLVPGAWMHIHIAVAGRTAKLYVNGATQPALTVNDLKQPVAPGSLALWIGPGTIAHFADLSYVVADPVR